MASVDLQGWDAVNAALFDTVNSAIATQRSSPTTFKLTNAPMANTTIDGNWKPWRLVAGGAGETLAVALPVDTGTATYESITFATLDPKTIGDLDLDASGLKVSGKPGGATVGSAFGTFGHQTGKYYFEITHDDTSNGTDKAFIGVAPNTASNIDFGRDARAYAYGTDGFAFNNNQNVEFAAAGGTTARGEGWRIQGAVVGVAVDFDNAKIWFRGPSGTWQGVGADPATGAVPAFTIDTSVALYPAVSILQLGAATLNLGGSPFKYAIPSGFRPGFSRTDKTSVVLDGATVSGTIRLATVPGKGTEKKLVPDTQANPTSPPTSVTNVILAGGAAAVPPIQTAFDSWLAANIDKFANVFHTIDIGGAASQPPPPPPPGGAAPPANNFAWLAPTGFAYAAVDEAGTNPTRSVLSILTMTQNRTSGTLAAQVPPEIVSNMPTGSNAVLAISAQRVAQQILQPALQNILNNTDATKFELDTLGTSVTNTVALSWRPMTLGSGTVVTPTIPAKGASLGIVGNKLKLSFSGLSFDYPGAVMVGTETVTFSFSQSFYLVLEKRSDGRSILGASFKDPSDPKSTEDVKLEDFTIDYQLSTGAKAFQISMAVASAILSLVTIGLVVGSVIKAGTAEAQVADNAANQAQAQGAATGDYGVIQLSDYGPPPAVIAADEDEAARLAAQGYSRPPPPPQTLSAGCSAFLAKPAVRLAIGAVFAGAFGGAGYWAMSANLAKDIAAGDIDKIDSRATVEAFLDSALAPFVWPETKTFTLKDVQLRGSLMFYGELT